MEILKVFKCTYCRDAVMLSLSENSSYADMCDPLVLRFKTLKVGSFSLRYSILNECNILLECDMDVRIMFMLSSAHKTDFIDIYVKDKSSDNQIIAVMDTIMEGNSLNDDSGASSSRDIGSGSSGEENAYLGKYKCLEGKKLLTTEWQGYIEGVGQKFEGGAVEFREKLLMYSMERGFKYVLVKNDKSRVTAECLKKDEDGCKWRVYASLCTVNSFFYIRTMNNLHTCSGMIREKKNVSLGSRVVSTLLLDKVRDNPLIKPVQIMRDFKESYGLDIPYCIAWYGKEIVNRSLHGDEVASYSHLHWYTNALLSTNPGSHYVLDVCGQTSRFQRLFISF